MLDTMKTFDEDKILKKLPEISPTQLPNLKAYLYRQILQSLRVYHMPRQIDMQIRSMIDSSHILYDKGLYDQALKMLDKAKRIATANNRSAILLDIMEQEKGMMSYTVSENNENRINRVVRETQDVVSNISNTNRFSNLATMLNSFYVKKGFVSNQKDYDEVKQFFKEHLPAYTESSLSFYEKLYLYHCYISYYFFIQNFAESYTYTVKYLDIFRDNPILKKQKFEWYLKGLNYQLVATYKLSLFHAFNDTYKILMKAPQIKGVTISGHLQMMLFKYKYMHKINQYFMMGDFTGGSKIIKVAENELDRFASRMDKHHVLIFYYRVACLYFGAGNFSRALLWLNKIINSRDVHIRGDILSFARILNLICHYELGNNDLLEHHIRSTYRFLLKKEGRFRYHVYIIRFLRNLNWQIQGPKLISRFEKLKEQMVPLEKHPYEKRPFLYFDIISWLESKIERKPIGEVMREKALKNISTSTAA